MDPDSGPPLELRRLRYFVAVAEELHFGRAAERLYIAQPVLSRQVRKLEQELGAELLVRSSRHVALTAAGLELLEEGRALLAAAELTRRRVADIAHHESSLTIGFFIGEEFTAARNAFSSLHPDVAINLLRIYAPDQTAVLLDGRADVAFVHLPVDDDRLEMVPVRSEPRVAALSVGHPAAGRPEISIGDLADDAVVIDRGATPSWQAFASVDPRPDGRQPRCGPVVGNLAEKLQHVAAGRAISFMPASMARAFAAPDIAYLPVSDIPPTRICLAWKADGASRLTRAFAGCVEARRRRPAGA